jgi:hypothetical protein
MTPYTYEASLEDEESNATPAGAVMAARSGATAERERHPTSLIVAFLLGVVAASLVMFGGG